MSIDIDVLDCINLYKEALGDFILECKKINAIHDILLRGTSCNWDDIVPFWSDIDLTVIADKINHSSVLKIRKFYALIQKKYSFKISLTLITLEDYKNKHHHHGLKPLYYNKILNDSHSLYGRSYPIKFIEDSKLTRYDSYLNLVYLIHDLRKSLLTLDDTKKTAFAIHLLKRAKHLVRNSIFVLSGYIDEDINLNLVIQYFPNIDPFYINLLKTTKDSFFYESRDNLDDIIEYVFNETEKMYALMLQKIEIFPDSLEFASKEEAYYGLS